MKLFVLLRNDLSPVQKVVQAAHVTAEHLKVTRDTPWTNGTLVILGVKDEPSLGLWSGEAKKAGVETSCFYEPDLSSNTGISFLLDKSEKTHKKFKRLMDKHLKLLVL